MKYQAKKQRSENEEKEKVVHYQIDNKKPVIISYYLDMGYQRHETIKLFQELEEKGFGQYLPGKRGRAEECNTRFVPNENCPTSYVMTFKVKKLISDYAGKKQLITTEEGKVEELKAYTSKIQEILDTPRTFAKVPEKNDGTGYVCTIVDNRVFVDRLSNAGYDSIGDALNIIWEDMKDRVNEKPTRHMSVFDCVVSKLKGVGFYELL